MRGKNKILLSIVAAILIVIIGVKAINQAKVDNDYYKLDSSMSKVSSSKKKHDYLNTDEIAEESSKTSSSSESSMPDNVMYGHLNESDFKQDKLGYYISKEFDYVAVLPDKDGNVRFVRLDFVDTPLPSVDDANDYISDWTSDDVTKVSDGLYHSDKLNKNYHVKFTKNGQDEITMIYIEQ
ncbi:hypothetical protein [Ligilactobacillus agilis]|uniref:hypothetical protein n=1 Tax=Ligilactobacillus agilis TaxID=1601 RepID=UPI00067F259C|nr:hypothetical protein [Ligilactobacillus agilis]